MHVSFKWIASRVCWQELSVGSIPSPWDKIEVRVWWCEVELKLEVVMCKINNVSSLDSLNPLGLLCVLCEIMHCCKIWTCGLGFSCPFAINPWRYVNCCHALPLNYFSRSSRCIVDVRTWFLRFLCLKHDFLHSGLMNARLSVHCTLKRAKSRN